MYDGVTHGADVGAAGNDVGAAGDVTVVAIVGTVVVVAVAAAVVVVVVEAGTVAVAVVVVVEVVVVVVAVGATLGMLGLYTLPETLLVKFPTSGGRLLNVHIPVVPW